MDISTTLRNAWRTFWVLKKHRTEPLWARLTICTGLALAIWLLLTLMTVAGLLTFETSDLALKRSFPGGGVIVCLSIGYTIFASMRLLEWMLSDASIARISPARDWRAALLLNTIVIVDTMLGWVLGLSVVGWVYHLHVWGTSMSIPRALTHFLEFLIMIAAVNAIFWRQRLRQRALQYQATESQLRLLQAQIEPHFLFNTLANVQSLMDYDPPRAKQMLETFTDYLRCSLGQLRRADSTLAAELDMAENYLQLLQIRMCERLRFRIEVSEEARAAILPTLLLQPLIENAIRHGLEPKVEGGQVRISASVDQGRLEICVEDDGIGLDAPPRMARSDAGMALTNIRARLNTRYADNASLTLVPQPVGTCVVLNLPYTTTP